MKKDKNKKRINIDGDKILNIAAGISMAACFVLLFLAAVWLENAPAKCDDWSPFYVMAAIGGILGGWPMIVAYIDHKGGD